MGGASDTAPRQHTGGLQRLYSAKHAGETLIQRRDVNLLEGRGGGGVKVTAGRKQRRQRGGAGGTLSPPTVDFPCLNGDAHLVHQSNRDAFFRLAVGSFLPTASAFRLTQQRTQPAGRPRPHAWNTASRETCCSRDGETESRSRLTPPTQLFNCSGGLAAAS